MILSILKVIGIILLVILLLLIFILGIFLFAPIRYQFDAKYEEKPDADVLVRWSPILLKVIVNYHEGNFVYIIRMFGGVVMTNQDISLSWIGRRFFSSKDDEVSRENDGGQTKRDSDNQRKTKKDFVVLDDEIELWESENKQLAMKDGLQKGNNGKALEDEADKSTQEPQKLEITSSKKLRIKKEKKPRKSFIKTIRNKVQSIKRKIKDIINKLKRLNEKKDALLKVYHSKRFEVAKKDAIVYIKTLWGIIKPKKLEGYVHFGLNDPASTGQVLGILATFLVWYDHYLQIAPDFEKACVDGYLKGNGKFFLFPITKLIIKILFNKNLIKVIKKVQTIIEA